MNDSLCTLYKYVMLFYIFFLGGGKGGSRKNRYVTKSMLSNSIQALQVVT